MPNVRLKRNFLRAPVPVCTYPRLAPRASRPRLNPRLRPRPRLRLRLCLCPHPRHAPWALRPGRRCYIRTYT